MDIKYVQDKFNEMWSSKVMNLDFNMINNSISIVIEILDGGITSTHIIEFREVSAYYFINNTGDRRKEFIIPETNDFLELTSISIIENSDLKIDSKEEWIVQYYSKVNVMIEIWNRVLFVEANQVVIDSKIIDLTA